jgi:dGTPase
MSDPVRRLAPYASHPSRSRGRRHPEPVAADRDAFQRDRDRVVHSTAFRRLVYKTQVFLNHEGDLFRTRLTHSLEVAQLGRSIARALSLNEDLVEAVALAHDLGHAPFGHAGQHALQQCLRDHGGFEHNLQSLRVVDSLERRYAAFDGLNLSLETREGILKHCSAADARSLEAAEPDGPARRFVAGGEASLEAQLTDLVDEIAYNAHDIDDGVRSGLLAMEQFEAVPLVSHHRAEAARAHPSLRSATDRRWLYETIRRVLSAQVHDVVDATASALARAKPGDSDDVRACQRLVSFSAEMRQQSTSLKRFLHEHLYRHPRVVHTTDKAQRVVRVLFEAYLASPGEMPPEFAQRSDRERAVADYVAGMTDRFALREHQRLTGRSEFAELAGIELTAIPSAGR